MSAACKGFPQSTTRRSVQDVSIRVRPSIAAAAVTLASVSWGASASAAPQHEKEQAPSPIVVRHLMSSCGNMDGY
jgi:hypothetical protein